MSVLNKKPFIKKILEETSDADLDAEKTYTLKVVISASGIPTFSWVVDN